MNLSSDYYGLLTVPRAQTIERKIEKLGERKVGRERRKERGRRKKGGREREEDRKEGVGGREGRNWLIFAVAQSLLTPLRVPFPFSETPPAAPLPPSHLSPVETHSQ